MTTLLLIDALCARLKQLFTGYSLLNKLGVLQEVKIFAQYTPQPAGISINSPNAGLTNYANEDYENNFPCIVVKLVESIDDEENRINQSTARVKFLTGIYDDKPECQGWRDILNIHERIREDFYVNRVTAERYRLNMPVKAKLYDVETWPVYFGEMDLVFEVGRPVMKEYIYRGRRL